MRAVVRTTTRRLGALGAALLLAAAAGCARPTAPPPAPEAAAPAASDFQARLDRQGVPLRLPPRGKAILVNLAAFELIAFEDAEPVLRSRVIVGTPRNPTPVLDTHVSTVRFRPSWRPTPDMLASGEYRDGVRPPGRNNPLGLAAVRLEPGLLIYLHDTNRRELFARDDRALSHGCIRVERWDALIAWLLEMDLETVRRHAEGSRSFDAPAPPVPVLIRSLTRFPDATGAPRTHPDPYAAGGAPAAAGCAPA